jgi:hypothetical protein
VEIVSCLSGQPPNKRPQLSSARGKWRVSDADRQSYPLQQDRCGCIFSCVPTCLLRVLDFLLHSLTSLFVFGRNCRFLASRKCLSQHFHPNMSRSTAAEAIVELLGNDLFDREQNSANHGDKSFVTNSDIDLEPIFHSSFSSGQFDMFCTLRIHILR